MYKDFVFGSQLYYFVVYFDINGLGVGDMLIFFFVFVFNFYIECIWVVFGEGFGY